VYLSQARNVLWDTSNQCTIATFSCNAGYYRDWTFIGCQSCPAIPANSQQGILAVCSLCNNTSYKEDRNKYCPFQCNNGYYASPSLDYSCIRCSTLNCSAGLYLQPCRNGETADSCKSCAYPLKANQDWTYDIPCEWHCVQGYYLVSADLTCVMCPPGKYKTSLGNQACTDSPPGSYSASPLSVLPCEKGTFTGASASSACSPCEKGTYMPDQNAIACMKCVDKQTYPTSISASVGATGCTLCGPLTPYSADGITCTLPIPPCPRGFYYSFASRQANTQRCELCPMGTYCETSGGSPITCPFAAPYSVMPAVSVNNCTATKPEAVQEDAWRTPCF
jgi:hypothetical protein